MKRSTFDPCVLINIQDEKRNGLILLHVDDTLGIADTKLLEKEEEASKSFRRKLRTEIKDKTV